MATITIPVGSRVQVSGKETLGIGVVRFCGETSFKTGVWVGIELSGMSLTFRELWS